MKEGKCPQCGKEFDLEKDETCPDCGTQLVEKEATELYTWGEFEAEQLREIKKERKKTEKKKEEKKEILKTIILIIILFGAIISYFIYPWFALIFLAVAVILYIVLEFLKGRKKQ